MEIIKTKVIDSIGRKNTKTIIKTNCDYCGKEFIFYGGLSHYNRIKRHYCSRSCQGNGNNVVLGNKLHGLGGHGDKKDKRYSMWCGAKKRALRKGFDFNLEIEDIPQIPKICPMLGIEIKANTTHSPLDSSPSLDRIDNTKGYIKGNIQIISNRANRIKSDATVEELEKLINFLRETVI